MSNEEMVNELKKDLVYNQYRDTYVIRGENITFMAERLVKLFAIPDVSNSLLLNEVSDIDTIGICANCGVEFHIHKSNGA